MKYRVHLYACVRFPFEVDAADPMAAAAEALKLADYDAMTAMLRGEAEYAEQIEDDCLVDLLDENGDYVENSAVTVRLPDSEPTEADIQNAITGAILGTDIQP